MTDLHVLAQPALVYRREAAIMLATSEKRIAELVREGHLTERYPDSKPRYLVEEIAEYARTLPTTPPRRAA